MVSLVEVRYERHLRVLSPRLVLTDGRLKKSRARLRFIQGRMRGVRPELRDALVTSRQVEIDVRDSSVLLIQEDVRQAANVELLDGQGVVVEHFPALERL
jgi:hypothetical protein